MRTSYSRRQGNYLYDIVVSEASKKTGRFSAQVVNMVRLESGRTVEVKHGLHEAHGATPDETLSKIEAAVEAWVKDQT